MVHTKAHGDRDPSTPQAAISILQGLELEVFQPEVRALQHQRTKIDSRTGAGLAITRCKGVSRGTVDSAIVVGPCAGCKVQRDTAGPEQRKIIGGIAVHQRVAEGVAAEMLNGSHLRVRNAAARQCKFRR